MSGSRGGVFPIGFGCRVRQETVGVNAEPVENQSFPPVVGADFVQETGDSFAGDQALGYKIVRPTPLVLP